MSELLEEIPLPGGLIKRVYDDGRISVVNQGGKYVKHPDNQLPPETAREVQRASKIRKAEKFQEDVDGLLNELGLDSLAARRLAELFVQGGSGAVSAARELFRMSKKYDPDPPTSESQAAKIWLDPALKAILLCQVSPDPDSPITFPDDVTLPVQGESEITRERHG